MPRCAQRGCEGRSPARHYAIIIYDPACEHRNARGRIIARHDVEGGSGGDFGCADAYHVKGAANLPDREVLLDLFEQMVLLRRFESVAQIACRKGETPGLPAPLHRRGGDRRRRLRASAPTDWVTSTHRGHGHALAKGADPGARDGRALRQGRRHLRRPRRHHASLRPLGRPVRHQRHRRRRHRPRRRHRHERRASGHATTSASPSSATAPPIMAPSTRR